MQKTAYALRISDWSSDVCSSDLLLGAHGARGPLHAVEEARLLHDLAAVLQDLNLAPGFLLDGLLHEADRIHVLGFGARAHGLARPAIGRASCRERVWPSV